jgi:hypothetical protein
MSSSRAQAISSLTTWKYFEDYGTKTVSQPIVRDKKYDLSKVSFQAYGIRLAGELLSAAEFAAASLKHWPVEDEGRFVFRLSAANAAASLKLVDFLPSRHVAVALSGRIAATSLKLHDRQILR